MLKNWKEYSRLKFSCIYAALKQWKALKWSPLIKRKILI
jgi:hypothetical protein